VAGKYLIHIMEVRFSNICLQTDRPDGVRRSFMYNM